MGYPLPNHALDSMAIPKQCCFWKNTHLTRP
ncbi:hypothetical protein CFP56_022982 [Quercus suber]|uniref:Uncharacterized protein n=1 Tax=Quercus suber TaxID=58331 RepID=A0AAW0KA00_QUESU